MKIWMVLYCVLYLYSKLNIMKKTDLKTGMIVFTRKNECSMVMLNTPDGDCFVGNGDLDKFTWGPFTDYDDDLKSTRKGDRNDDIVEVWGYANNRGGGSFKLENRE
jgi:hypothetical protein